VYVLGTRVHEWHLGSALLLGLALGAALRDLDPSLATSTALFVGIWLVVTGASAFVHIPFANTGQILSALALAAGILILLGR
jgi:hypothetical protein